ncbi:protein LIFEGUARD 2-like [Miscanthus floridulus]|uniref:protein LIFEGUARD 2-like n=1 Tax=Miscanthus floridulus TaxID=154761 RepID=UPI003459E108
MFPMLKYREKHPRNLVLLALFTLCCSLSIAVSASSTLGYGDIRKPPLDIGNYQYMMEDMAVLPDITFLCLTVMANGHAFEASAFHVLRLSTDLLPAGKGGQLAMTIYGFLATLVFSGFIVYDTHMLLKRHTFNEYVVAAISRYLDVINLFMAQMSLSSWIS